jgi:rhodanese-related sulfurtransferase
VHTAWQHLADDRSAQLIDVRTAAEWTFVGVPDLAALGKRAILVEWQTYPNNRPNPEFVVTCRSELDALGSASATPLYFLCRSGARSHSAAVAMNEAGYARCYNVAEGFEGPLDERRQRTVSGWKVAGLPWMQG